MTNQVLLVNPGLKPGGMTVDLENLAVGLEARGVEVTRAGTSRDVLRAVRLRPGAIVHLFGCLPSPVIFATFALAKLRRMRLVWTPTFHPTRPHTYGWSIPHIPMRAFDALAPRLACLTDALIALTPAEGEYFEAIRAPRVYTIPHGVHSVSTPDPEAIRNFREHHGLIDRPLVLVLGRASPRHKGLAFALASFSKLRQRLPTAVLLLVGGLSDPSGTIGVRSLGWLSDVERDLAIASADVLFVSSAYEALSRAVIEGWSAATPVVATDRVALAATLRANAAGSVVPFGNVSAAADALLRLIEDRELARDSACRGQNLVAREYLLADIVPKVLELYRQIGRRRATLGD